MSAVNTFNLERFIDAQDPIYATVVAELRAGRKRRHWMWFVFPQHRALGLSGMAKRFGIESLAEAKAYAAHAIRVCASGSAVGWFWRGMGAPSTRSSARRTT